MQYLENETLQAEQYQDDVNDFLDLSLRDFYDNGYLDGLDQVWRILDSMSERLAGVPVKEGITVGEVVMVLRNGLEKQIMLENSQG